MVQKLVKRSEIYGLRSSLIEETQILYPWYTPGYLKYTVDKLSASSREREMVAINALLDIASNKMINKRNEPNSLSTAAHKYALDECCIEITKHKKEAKRGRLPKNLVVQVIRSKEQKYNLPKMSISLDTIRSRIKRGNCNTLHREILLLLKTAKLILLN